MATGLPLDLLIVFTRVAEAGGFTAAARDLNLSKATVSKQIAELEARLGVQLFHRTTRRLALTEAGERALTRAGRILAEAEALSEEAAEARERPQGKLRIAAPLTFGIEYLSLALPDFLAAFPDIELELALDDRFVDLIGDRYDAALRISALTDSSFVARNLAPVRLHVVASPDFWRKHGRATRPEDLARVPCFRYANNPNAVMWSFTGPNGEERNVRIDGPLSVNNGSAVMPSVCAGLGATLAPDFIVWRDLKAGRLEAALEGWAAPQLTLHLLTPHGRAQPRRLRAFSDFVHERFGAGRAPWLGPDAPKKPKGSA
jgi:DNA-binding transcriptional LysR family regulator